MTDPSDSERWRHQTALALVPSFACNLRCKHCFAPTDQAGRGMTASELGGLLDQVEPLGFRSVEVTGGELLAHPQGAASLPRIARLGVPTTILTNGTLLEQDHVSALAGSQATLRLSVDGPEPVHDALRGHGAFAKTRQAARLCVEAAVSFDLCATVTRRSLPHLADTVEVALQLGARGIHFGPLHRLGGRSDELSEQRLDEEGCVELAATLNALRNRVPDGFALSWRSMTLRAVAVMHPCSVYACWGEFCLSQKHWPDALAVLPDGEVVPQSLHIHPRYSLGNAFREGLDTVVNRYWGSERHADFRTLCRYIYQDLIYGRDETVLLWDELAHEASQRPTAELPRYETVTHPHDHSDEIEQARRDGELDDIVFPRPLP